MSGVTFRMLLRKNMTQLSAYEVAQDSRIQLSAWSRDRHA